MRKNKAEKLALSNFKSYYKATVITYVLAGKIFGRWDRSRPSYIELIFNKDGQNNLVGKKTVFSTNRVGTLSYPSAKQ